MPKTKAKTKKIIKASTCKDIQELLLRSTAMQLFISISHKPLECHSASSKIPREPIGLLIMC